MTHKELTGFAVRIFVPNKIYLYSDFMMAPNLNYSSTMQRILMQFFKSFNAINFNHSLKYFKSALSHNFSSTRRDN